MFKPGRWRSDKDKHKLIKVDFKLQFHATQVPQLGADGLVLSLVPGDVGKPTVKLEKSTVKDGVCEWKDPVYEAVKFTRDLKTGKINEKIYYFVVAQGSSKASVVDNVTINFADYAEATKASSISFPLKNSTTNAMLHVMIQKISENADQREVVEDNVHAKVKTPDRSLRSHLSRGEKDEESINSNSTEEAPPDKSPHDVKLSGNFRTSSGSDLTISSSESSSGLNTPRELGTSNNVVHQEASPFISSPRPMSRPTADALVRVSEEHQRSRLQWSGSFCREEISGGPEAHQRGDSVSASNTEIEMLKVEISSLARQADMAELELQTLRKQIMKEIKRGQDLFKENIGLKEERDALKIDCGNLKAFNKCVEEVKVKSKLQNEGGGMHSLLDEIRQELTHEKNLNANLRLQLEKMQESNAELILAVKDLDEMLEQKNREISDLSSEAVFSKRTQPSREDLSKCETSDDEEQNALEEIIKQHKDAQETYMLEQRIIDLKSEIEIFRRDKDELEMQMEQLALDYEILKQKNHDLSYKLEQSELQEKLQQYDYSSYPNLDELEHKTETLESDLEKKSKELSDSIATINELEINVQSLRHDLERKSEDYLQSVATISELESENESFKSELEMKSSDYSISLANINELECSIETLKSDLDKKSRDYSDSLARINELEGNIESLKSDLERKTKDYSAALGTINELDSSIETLRSDLERKSKDYSNSLVTINELENNIEPLKSDVERKSRDYLDSLATINKLERDMETVKEELEIKSKDLLDSLTVNKELETRVKNLEAQLEKQVQEFESNLDIITRAKVEQEQRAIKAEDGLRKMKLKNVDTAERLQEEFRRLSMQMASTFDENEKLAMKAMAEAGELRRQNSHLAEMICKANTELHTRKAEYEAELSKLSKEMQMKNDCIEKMTQQIDETAKELKQQRNCANEVDGTLSEELAMLRSEIERLTTERNALLEQAAQNGNLMKELEHLRRSIEEAELVMQKGKEERNELVTALALMRKEMSDLMEELNILKHIKDEKNVEVQNLESELRTLKFQCNDMKQSILHDELERENPRKQLFQLKKDLKKKENALTTVEKRLKESSGHHAISDATKGVVRNNKSALVAQDNKEVAGLREKIKSLESLIRSKEVALEASTNSFFEKEKDLQNKIDDLESRLEEANQNYINLDKCLIKSVVEGKDGSTTDRCDTRMPTEGGDVTNSKNEVVSEEETKTSTTNIHNSDADVSIELASLREINESMQAELKELQGKYSEMSLKFAEVEGERQKLVMTVRTLKNAKRS